MRAHGLPHASAVAGHFVATKRKFVYFVKSATGVFPSRSRSHCRSHCRSPPEPGRRLLLTFASQNHRRDLFPPCPVSVCPCLAFCVGAGKSCNQRQITRFYYGQIVSALTKNYAQNAINYAVAFFCLSGFALHCLFSFYPSFILLCCSSMCNICIVCCRIVYWTTATAAAPLATATPTPARSLLKGSWAAVAYFLGLSKLDF